MVKAKLKGAGIDTDNKQGNWRQVSTKINKDVFFIQSSGTFLSASFAAFAVILFSI